MEVALTNGDITRHAHTPTEIVRLKAAGFVEVPPTVEVPPREGRGSGREAWAHYAEAYDIPLSDDMTRDEIIATCMVADVLPAEPSA